jgi:hypothetical protein
MEDDLWENYQGAYVGQSAVPLNVWVRELDITCHSCGSPVWGTTTTCCPDGVGSISFTPTGQCKPVPHEIVNIKKGLLHCSCCT